MSRFCSSRLLRQLTTIVHASSSRVHSTVKLRQSLSTVRHHTSAAFDTGTANDEDLQAEYEESYEPPPRTNQIKFSGKRQPRRTIIVRNFDPQTTSLLDIRQLMEQFGQIKQMSASSLAFLSTLTGL